MGLLCISDEVSRRARHPRALIGILKLQSSKHSHFFFMVYICSGHIIYFGFVVAISFMSIPMLPMNTLQAPHLDPHPVVSNAVVDLTLISCTSAHIPILSVSLFGSNHLMSSNLHI